VRPLVSWGSRELLKNHDLNHEGRLLNVSHPTLAVSPTVTAALLLCARESLAQLGLPAPSAAQVLKATGAGRSRAYELLDDLRALLPGLQRPPGRPARPEQPVEPPPAEPTHELTLQTLRFVAAHPGCLSTGSERAHYTEAFRLHALELRRQHAELSLEAFAAAIDVPFGTLKDWLAVSGLEATDTESDATSSAKPEAPETTGATAPTNAWIETVLSEYRTWCGSFVDFCSHIQQHCRVPLGRSAIAAILEADGVRLRLRRQGRSPDEEALRGSFVTFFPGAQWEGDGRKTTVTIDQEPFTFNLELVVDTYSDGFVGLCVTDTEDSAAVTTAFDAGVETTGEPPLDVLLDNRPSNHTPQVDAALGPDTLRTRSTPGRAQNKAHVEGAFGLFAQALPALLITATTRRELARQVLELVATTFARAINHRPRRDRQGRSRADLYTDKPTPEQVAQARAELIERHRKQQLAQQTALSRQDPLLLLLIEQAFHRLGLVDPDQHFAAALCRYGRDAVVEGIAIFDAKNSAGTLPNDVDARYLLGIVRNVAHDSELCDMTASLIDSRLAARDLALQILRDDRAVAEQLHCDTADLLAHHTDRATGADRNIDRVFWTLSAANTILAAASDDPKRADWTRYAAARIGLATHLSQHDRANMIRLLTRRVLPLT
jgi:hypothetical protein